MLITVEGALRLPAASVCKALTLYTPSARLRLSSVAVVPTTVAAPNNSPSFITPLPSLSSKKTTVEPASTVVVKVMPVRKLVTLSVLL